jgi:hypothetical protein
MSYASTDLLAQFKATSQVGTNYEGTSDAEIYRLLSNAQQRLYRIFAAHVPDILVGSPEQLTTSDGGYTYNFAAFPLGHAELRDGRNGPILVPGPDWDESLDVYVPEGQKVRFPGNRRRTFANGLWARYVATPGVIDASTQPTLQPPNARQALVYDACVEWATQGGYRDPAPFQLLRQHELWGDPANPGDVGIIPSLKMQHMVGAVGTLSTAWWRSGDLTG